MIFKILLFYVWVLNCFGFHVGKLLVNSAVPSVLCLRHPCQAVGHAVVQKATSQALIVRDQEKREANVGAEAHVLYSIFSQHAGECCNDCVV